MINPKMFLNPNLFNPDVEQIPTRYGYGEGLSHLGKTNPNIVVLTGDLKESTKVENFAMQFPDRFFECGVAEQNMTSIAAGLGISGKVPFISSYAVFSPGRSWDQVRVNIAYNNSNVKIAGAHTGLSVGPDGASHQALEDIAIMRVLPNMTVIAPADSLETQKTTQAVTESWGPAYFRFSRDKTPVLTTDKTPFKIGRAEIYWEPVKESPKAVIIACGPLIYEALLAAAELKKIKIPVTVINNHTIKPLDTTTILRVVSQAGAVVTVEEHQITGGLGGAVAEMLATTLPVPIEFIGMPDQFGESGEPDQLLEKYNLKSAAIIEAVKTVIARKKS